ncbi:MAG: ribosomal L7Ae/L30e/S12e/Gadd45 family protein [Clostridia bacterium]|nr:ribosomal L7Ae/L30e/S12e/Gadd45 family protein [Clostridia bacterium]
MTDHDKDRLLTALGFAMKAGKIVSGELAAEKALRSGRAKLAAVDAGASENTKKHWSDITGSAGVPIVFADGVGKAIGKSARMVACITDSGFAEMALKCRIQNEE